MMMQSSDVENLIAKFIPGSSVKVETEDGHHFLATVIAEQFTDQKPLERQKMVYRALGDTISNGTVHAIRLKTYTEEEWKNLCESC